MTTGKTRSFDDAPIESGGMRDAMATVRELRAMGAVRLRVGAIEAEFAGVPEQEPATPEVERAALTRAERRELETLRMRAIETEQMNEELGVD